MENLEQLASFYLGNEHDLTKGQKLDALVHYDARDLTTHAVCVGMTGSGKTGLGVILLEEAALDGVPSLIIDPKGDMTNLLLTFPELRPEDFRPWVNPDDARRKDMDVDAFAARTADLWRNGLAGSGQGPDRIRRLKEAADFGIYTPGSSAGLRLSILHTLKAPPLSWGTQAELIRDKIGSVVSALLALVGIEADPVRSREHILLSNIFENAWRAGEDLDLAQLLLRIQKPPFSQLGVFPVDTFFPEKDRMDLAMLLNGLMAAPSFADWIQGQPLDINSLLHGPAGKPRVTILYIAHLSEAERQFFVTLLLEQVVSWMGAQSGTTSLRALLYMDEMFGYLPPHPANPPTKKPLLTLLKQARAFGLGLILATQNPVDLDYKALSNAGTWFIGRLQADRDKQRVLDGLEGVQVGSGGTRRSDFDRMISALQSRVFLLHNVHQDHPVVFQTRWAMSYLRGPLTRDQVSKLVGEHPAPPAATASPQPAAAAPQAPPEPQSQVPYSQVPPQLPSRVKQVFLRANLSLDEALARLASERGWSRRSKPDHDAYLIYDPALLGLATVRFLHAKSRQTQSEEVAYLLPLDSRSSTVDWSQGKTSFDRRKAAAKPAPGAYFGELPTDLGDAKRHTALEKEFDDYLYYNSSLTLWYNPHLKIYSEMGENEKSFQRRCREEAADARDEEAKKLETKYRAKLDSLENKVEREEREMEEDKIEYDARKQEELLSGAETLLGLFGGRKATRSLSTASRKRRMTRQAKADIKESEEAIEEMEDEIEDLKKELKGELEELTEQWAQRIDDWEEEEVRPRRADVQINLFALAWVPRWEVSIAGQQFSVPAFETEPD
jgi:hypothetical protein